MIALNETEQIRELVASQIEVRKFQDNRFSVDIPWSYPDGDCCRVYVTKEGDDEWIVSDGGDSVMRASYACDVDLFGPAYADRLQGILRMHGLTQSHGEVVKHSPNVGDAVFAVAQASVDMVHLARLPRAKKPVDTSQFLIDRLTNGIDEAIRKSTCSTYIGGVIVDRAKPVLSETAIEGICMNHRVMIHITTEPSNDAGWTYKRVSEAFGLPEKAQQVLTFGPVEVSSDVLGRFEAYDVRQRCAEIRNDSARVITDVRVELLE